MSKYLDDNGLSHVWQNIKSALANKADKSEITTIVRENVSDIVYPVGSIYMSVVNTSPATFLKGTWIRIEDTFLLAAGSTHTAGTAGGSETVTLTADQLPSHNHGQVTLQDGFYLGSTVLQRDNAVHSKVSDKNAGNSVVTVSRTSSEAYTSGTTPKKIASYTGNDTVTINATHTHASVGNGEPHNNMPPYLAVYMWKRTA